MDLRLTPGVGAFAVQVLFCRDKLGIPNDRLNVGGGAIALGHPGFPPVKPYRVPGSLRTVKGNTGGIALASSRRAIC